MSTGTEVDFEAVKQVQQKTWAAGDFAAVATMGVIVGERLSEAVNVLPGERVLDVACGSGNAAIAAARRSWGGVVGIDFVPALLERGRERADHRIVGREQAREVFVVLVPARHVGEPVFVLLQLGLTGTNQLLLYLVDVGRRWRVGLQRIHHCEYGTGQFFHVFR